MATTPATTGAPAEAVTTATPATAAPSSASSAPASSPSDSSVADATTPQGDTPAQNPASPGATPAVSTDLDDVSAAGFQLTAEERKQFGGAINALPKDAQGLLQKFLTQKTQKISEQRKVLEAFEQDPVGFANEVIRLSGAASATPAPGTPAAAAATPAVTDTNAADILASALGEEYAFLAPALAPALSKLVDSAIASRVAPLETAAQAQQAQAQLSEVSAGIAKFRAEHPDFDEHFPAMAELSKTLKPNGMDHGEYLGHLHTLASAKQSEASKVRKAIDAIQRAASASDTPSTSVPAARVAPVAPVTGNLKRDIASAFEMAKRGESIEQ